MKLDYLMLRLGRHFMPESLARFLLRRRWIIRPGLETSDPLAAVDNYLGVLKTSGLSIIGKRALDFGYGGRFAVGVELLARGASHVVLCEHLDAMDEERNLRLLPKYQEYLTLDAGRVRPRSEYLTLLIGDIRQPEFAARIEPVDFVLSSSVYEHLEDVDGITRALARLTKPDGLHVHYVDLRDHYFKYPFEMLSYSERVWNGWLNPSSHHNRFRLRDYRRVFETYFDSVEIDVLERNESAFEQARSRIRPEFLSGDSLEDSVTLIRVIASRPRR